MLFLPSERQDVLLSIFSVVKRSSLLALKHGHVGGSCCCPVANLDRARIKIDEIGLLGIMMLND